MIKYYYDKVVIGNTLSALIYSFLHGLPLLLNGAKQPSKIDYFAHPIQVPLLQDFPSQNITTLQGSKMVGPNKLDVWNRLCFLMSLEGQIPFADKISSIRIDAQKKELKVITNYSHSTKIETSAVIVFDDDDITGLPTPTNVVTDDDERRVEDWISVRSGMVHEYDRIDASSRFVNSIHFYPSDRIDGNHQNRKDLVAVSYLTKKQLNDIEYSDLFVRYKVLDIMKKAGIRGRRNGRDVNNPGKYKYYAIKLEMYKRKVDVLQKNLYNDTSFINFAYDTEEDLLESAEAVPSSILKLYSRLTNKV